MNEQCLLCSCPAFTLSGSIRVAAGGDRIWTICLFSDPAGFSSVFYELELEGRAMAPRTKTRFATWLVLNGIRTPIVLSGSAKCFLELLLNAS